MSCGVQTFIKAAYPFGKERVVIVQELEWAKDNYISTLEDWQLKFVFMYRAVNKTQLSKFFDVSRPTLYAMMRDIERMTLYELKTMITIFIHWVDYGRLPYPFELKAKLPELRTSKM